MKKKFATLLIMSLGLGLTGCKKKYLEAFQAGEIQGYENGYNDGHADGFQQGFSQGYDSGWNNAKIYFASADYHAGFNDGHAQGAQAGYNIGYTEGRSDGIVIGYDMGYGDGHVDGTAYGYDLGYGDGMLDGYDLGYDDGHFDGGNWGYDLGYGDGYTDGQASGNNPAALQAAYNSGYNDGYYDGYDDGMFNGYNLGFDDGYDYGFGDGYNFGFDDGYFYGWWDGYDYGTGGFSNDVTTLSATDLDGLPHNNIRNLNPEVSFAANLVNDLVDLRQVRGLEEAYVNGFKQSVGLLEETQMNSRDINKINAKKEAFRTEQLAKQIESNFGLKSERAKNVAKLAVLWRKNANSRAITEEDANAFSESLIGVNVKTVEQAYIKTTKGEFSDMKKVLKEAAKVNGISELHASKLMLKLFL
jgi:hypothetical protein